MAAPKKSPATPDLEVLRAEVEVAEAALEGAPEEVRASAEANLNQAQEALGKAHLENVKVAPKVETRPAEPHAETRALSLQESNQSASTQNVRGTHELSPRDHAKRRAPLG